MSFSFAETKCVSERDGERERVNEGFKFIREVSGN
jgi:hypothetical protein